MSKLYNFLYKVYTFVHIIYNKILVILLGSKGIIFVFHEICEDSDVIEKNDLCHCSISNFDAILKYVSKKYNFVSLDYFLNSQGRQKMCVITFDDVPISFYNLAYPLLKKYQIPFTLYVSSHFLNRSGYLSERELQILSQDTLCTIGAHTMDHIPLRFNSNSYSSILNSKLFLENLLTIKILHFAYPFGRYSTVSRKNIREVQKADFCSAVSTIPTAVPRVHNLSFLPRIAVNDINKLVL